MPIVEKVPTNRFRCIASVDEIYKKDGPIASYKEVTIDFETAKTIAMIFVGDAFNLTQTEDY